MRILALVLLLLSTSPAMADSPPPFAAFARASAPVLHDPHDLTIGPDGRLYVADKLAGRIAVLNADTLELEEVLGEGAFPQMRDISFGADGRVALAVSGFGVVPVYASIDALKADIGTPAALYRAPQTEGALLHSGGRVYAMSAATGVLTAYDGETVSATAQGHFGAHDVAEGADGAVWVADNFARRLVKYAPDLTRLQVLDHAKFGFIGPRYLDITDDGLLVVADQDAHRVLLIDPDAGPDGALLGVLGDGSPGLGPNRFDDPEGVAVSGARYYVSDSDNNRVVMYVVATN